MCGITALISKKDNIFPELYESLYHLQHRGQDSFGFSYFDKDKNIKILKQQGLVSNYDHNSTIQTNIGMGHVRYPTQGSNTIHESQPLYLIGKYHTISLIHNGQIDINEIKQELDIDIENSSDTKYLLHYLSFLINKYVILNDENILKIVDEIQLLNGSFNCICLIEGFGLLCFKDKYSIRPLVLGKKDDTYIISSESISITSIDYEIVNDIYGYDILLFNKTNRLKKLRALTGQHALMYFKPCIFEWVYLAREESTMYGMNVYQSRVKMGKFLAKKIMKNVDIDMIDLVVPVPDTSKPVALEISKQINKPYSEAITKNRYVNRTFIMDSQQKRKRNIKRKLNVIQHLVKNKNILIVDDSIVRGNTIKHIVNLLKENDVNKIFIAISSPEIVNTNKYGIDIPTREELLCFNKTNQEIQEDLGIEKIIFQNLSDLESSIDVFAQEFETSVFT